MYICYSVFKRLRYLTAFLLWASVCSHAAEPFEYRSLYTPTNADETTRRLLETHHVDYDWGLWGHNLHKVFSGGIPKEACALPADGKVTSEQYCFSSDRFYEAIVHYITDNFGEGTASSGERFSIMPNDNAIVCQCSQCKKAGNTPASATPAVARMVTRLAHRFPHHTFFTSSYGTTVTPPEQPLPQNTGVWISAMDWPCSNSPEAEKAMKVFKQKVERWSTVVGRVYVWDYMRNFDDYFTPYPCLSFLKQRIRLFREIGVKGVFYNGSGDIYASFDDVQTYVLAQLLRNPDLSIQKAIQDFYDQQYPTSGRTLAAYYWNLEEKAVSNRMTLPYYGGISQSVVSRDLPAFVQFCRELRQLLPLAEATERTRLSKLQAALCLTQLELQRFSPEKLDKQLANENLEILRTAVPLADMQYYREAEGNLQRYIDQWKELMELESPAGNRLLFTGISCTTEKDKDECLCPPLTDGRYGLPADYHTSWLIFESPVTVLSFPAPDCLSAEIRLSVLYAPRWRIFPPRQITVWQNGRQLAELAIPSTANRQAFTRIILTCKIQQIQPDSPVVLHISRQEGNRFTWACDEIEWYENK